MADIPATVELRATLTKYVNRYKSFNLAAQSLGVARETLSRAMAGIPVREGTILLLEKRLRKESGEK